MTRTVTHVVTTTAAPPEAAGCAASDLTGTFTVLEGSAGAGNIVYTLKLTNASQGACFVSGIPEVQPLDAGGGELEYSATPNGEGTAVKAVLQPGDSATAQARFSPTVTPCGSTAAATLRVTATGGGTLDVPVSPPTRVCNHGAMQWTPLTTAA